MSEPPHFQSLVLYFRWFWQYPGFRVALYIMERLTEGHMWKNLNQIRDVVPGKCIRINISTFVKANHILIHRN